MKKYSTLLDGLNVKDITTLALSDCDKKWSGVEHMIFGGFLSLMTAANRKTTQLIAMEMMRLLKGVDSSVMLSLRGTKTDAKEYLPHIQKVSALINQLTADVEGVFTLSIISQVVLAVPGAWLDFHERFAIGVVTGRNAIDDEAIGAYCSPDFVEECVNRHEANVAELDNLIETKIFDVSSPCLTKCTAWHANVSKLINNTVGLTLLPPEQVVAFVEHAIGAPWLEDPSED